jgi:pimeloyl-ACP methyl ester carboxylesterase
VILLTHNSVQLALHEMKSGTGRPLLLLHGLGEATAATVPPWVTGWPGPVHGLDFTGHGASTLPGGGGYTAEVLMADADAALAHLGPCTVLGRGLGGYVALLIAGARPSLVRGAIIADGPGLAGGGAMPASLNLTVPADAGAGPPDPFALLELARDVRPPDYAANFARLAVQLSGLDTAIAVAARVRPPWLQAVVDEPGVAESSLAEGLALFSR